MTSTHVHHSYTTLFYKHRGLTIGVIGKVFVRGDSTNDGPPEIRAIRVPDDIYNNEMEHNLLTLAPQSAFNYTF